MSNWLSTLLCFLLVFLWVPSLSALTPQEKQELTLIFQQYKQQVAQLRLQANSSVSNSTQLQTQVNDLSTQVQTLDEQVQTLQSQVDEGLASVETLRALSVTLNERIQSLKASLQAIEHENALLKVGLEVVTVLAVIEGIKILIK